MVCDGQAILVFEVLGDADFITIVNEFRISRIRLKINIIDLVGLLVTPIGDDAGAHDLFLDFVFELLFVLGILFDHVDLV